MTEPLTETGTPTDDDRLEVPAAPPMEAPGQPTGEPEPPIDPRDAPTDEPPIERPPVEEPPGEPPPPEPPPQPEPPQPEPPPPPEPPGEPGQLPMEAPGAPGQPPSIQASDPSTDEARTDDQPRTVGRLIADALRSAGVRYAFTVPGESFLGLLDALGEAGIRVVATRHEGGAAFMAEAHGQLTGRPAACLGTRGVGAANLAIGIHTARQDSTPMFAIVGQVERAHRGHEAFQEIDQVATIGGLAKWAAEPSDPADVAPVMSEAIRQALGGRPGPVLLSFAEDLLDQPAPSGQPGVDEARPVS